MKWYDVCDDYSLAERETAPDVSGMDSYDNDAGTVYAFDFEDEGAIYFYGFAKLNGYYLEEV